MQSRKQKRRVPTNPATILLVRQLVTGLLIFSVVAVIITAIWYLARLESVTITTVAVSGNETVAATQIETAVQEVLSGTYLGLIPRRFSWLYPETAVRAAVLAVPKIKSLDLVVENSQTLRFSITEYVPDALWCEYTKKEECFFLDETGYAFSPAPNLSGGSMVRFFTLQQNPERGSYPVTELVDYAAAKGFATALAEVGWYVSTIEIDTVRDAFFTLTHGGEIKLTLKADTVKSFSYLQSLRSSAEFQHLAPGNFQYLDLRFGAKVFVNEESLVGATSTAATTVTETGGPQ